MRQTAICATHPSFHHALAGAQSSGASRWPVLAVSLLLGMALGGCGKTETPAPPEAAPTVVAEPARQELVEDEAAFVGRVVAINKVELRARVEGFLKEQRFTEGDRVEEGQVLFLIEPDQYLAVVEQRLADVASAKANELNANAQLRRGQELLQSKNIAQSKVDELQAAESVAQANIQQAQAALNAAELNLSYTQITAPVSGRIGLANFTVGNLVNPQSGALATIVSQNPIYVQFPVTQRELLEARREIEDSGGNPKDVKVLVELPDGKQYDHSGRLDFVDVTTDQTTDSVTLRAKIANPDGLLIDGQFVNLTLALGDPDEAVVVPQSALQVDQQGIYIFVVDQDNKAQIRRIQTGPTKGADVAVTQGLKEGELVIIEGIQKVRPGQEVRTSPPPAAGNSDTGGSSDPDPAATPTPAAKPADDATQDTQDTQDTTQATDNDAGADEEGTQSEHNDQAEQQQNSEANAL